jgi:hypothetical protein
VLSAKELSLIVGIALFSSPQPALSQSQQDKSPPESISSVRPPAGEARSASWTRERMRQAQPLPLPRADVPSAGQTTSPKPRSSNELKSSPSRDVKSLARYTGDVNVIPLRWMGQLFYTNPAQDGFRCSAQFISTNVILTAAHCVRDHKTGQFYNDFRFALQYHNGDYSRLYGYRCVATKNGWVGNDYSHYGYDYAMLLADSPSVTGWFGMTWDWQGKYNNATKLGYPKGIIGGKLIQVDAGPLDFEEFGQNVISLHHGRNEEQGGTSGGAWVADFSYSSAASSNHIISVSSHTRGDDESVLYGPYFDDNFRELFDYVSRGCR